MCTGGFRAVVNVIIETMKPLIKPIKNAAVLAYTGNVLAVEEATKMQTALQQKGIRVTLATSSYDAALIHCLETCETDVLIAFGGDGTVLRATRLAAPYQVPVLGINAGNLGFLTAIQHAEWPLYLDHIAEGRYWIEERMLLNCTHHRGDSCLQTWTVLNEVVVCRGEQVRPVKLAARVDGVALASYVADGLIAATPTGSTAYALAADGPVLPPELRNILLVPIAPHFTFDKAIVLSEGSTVVMEVLSSHNAVLSADGQPAVKLHAGDEVHVTASDLAAWFVRFRDRGYFYEGLHQYLEKYVLSAGESV